MIKPIYILFLYLISITSSCIGQNIKKNSLENENLNGTVKSTKEISFILEEGKPHLDKTENTKYDAYNIYNRKGYLKSQFNYYYDKNNPTEIILKYDKNDYCTELLIVNFDRSLIAREEIIYDKDYNKLEINRFRSDSTLEEKRVYLTKKELHIFNSKEELIEKVTFQYDSLDNLIEENTIHFIDEDSRGGLRSSSYTPGYYSTRYSYKYDKKNRKIKEDYYIDNWRKQTLLYTYNELNDVSKIIGIDSGEKIEGELHFEYKYDFSNNWIEKTFYADFVPSRKIKRKITYY